jgi:hypothetical protein
LNQCRFTWGNFEGYGFINGVGPSGQRLSVSILGCNFQNVYAKISGGAVRGSQPKWIFESCTFENCSCDNEAGDFLYITPNAGSSTISNILDIHLCQFMNKNTNVGKQQIMLLFHGESGSNAHLLFHLSSISWAYVGGQVKRGVELVNVMSFEMEDSIFSWDTNTGKQAALIAIDLESNGVGFVENCTVQTALGVSDRVNGFQLSDGIFVLNNCSFTNIRVALWGESVSAFACQPFKLSCFGCNFLEDGCGYWGNMKCSFLLVSCQFIEKTRSMDNIWAFWELGQNSNQDSPFDTLTIECCCFQSNRAARSGIYSYSSGTIIIGSGNCFSMTPEMAVVDGTQVGGVEQIREVEAIGGCTSCSSGCQTYSVCPYQTAINGAGLDFNISNCVWENRTNTDDGVVYFSGRDLNMRSCKFMNCGWSGGSGCCIQAELFTGDICVDNTEFIQITGDRGGIFVSNTMERKVELYNCSFIESIFRLSGCLSAFGSGQALTLFVNHSVFDDCYVSDGSGPISSEQPILNVEDSVFKNCRIGSESCFGCFIWQRHASARGTSFCVNSCEFENGDVSSVSTGSIWFEARDFARRNSLFSFRNSTFHWDTTTSHSSPYPVIGTMNIKQVLFELAEIVFASTLDTIDKAFCHFLDTTRVNFTRCELKSREAGSGCNVAIVCGCSISLNTCQFSYLKTGISIIYEALLSVTYCQFTDLESNSICSSSVACEVIMEHSYFGESRTDKSDAFLYLPQSSSSVRLEFCCFQINTLPKLAVSTTGSIVIGTENCFSHPNQTTAFGNSGQIVVQDICGFNHYDCRYCRSACPTAAFNMTYGFSESHAWKTTNLHNESDLLRQNEELNESISFSVLSDLSESSGLLVSSSLDDLLATGTSLPAVSFSETAFFSESSLLSVSDRISRSNSLLSSTRLTASCDFRSPVTPSESSLFSGSDFLLGSVLSKSGHWVYSDTLSGARARSQSERISKSPGLSQHGLRTASSSFAHSLRSSLSRTIVDSVVLLSKSGLFSKSIRISYVDDNDISNTNRRSIEVKTSEQATLLTGVNLSDRVSPSLSSSARDHFSRLGVMASSSVSLPDRMTEPSSTATGGHSPDRASFEGSIELSRSKVLDIESREVSSMVVTEDGNAVKEKGSSGIIWQLIVITLLMMVLVALFGGLIYLEYQEEQGEGESSKFGTTSHE